MIVRILILFFILCAVDCFSQDVNALYRSAMAAEEAGNHTEALNYFLEVDEVLNNHPTVLFHIAKNASVGEPDLAQETLKRLMLINADLEILEDSLISQLESIEQLRSDYLMMNELKTNSQELFTIPDNYFHPEGVAVTDEGHYALSSIRKGMIMLFDQNGKQLKTIHHDRFYSVSGIDYRDGVIWITSPPAPQLQNFDSIMVDSRLFKVDLNSGEIKEISLELEGVNYLGDLLILQDGSVLVTDSSTPRILQFTNEKLNKEYKLPGFSSIQGICQGDGQIFFSDYRLGIFTLDMKSGDAEEILMPAEMSAKGTDGLCFYNNSLILIQNGVNPKRITQVNLSNDYQKAVSFRYLEKANPLLNEPTLGTVKNGELIYVGNSPWPYYSRENEFKEEPPRGLIMKIELN